MPKKKPKNLQTLFMALSTLIVGATIALVGVEMLNNSTADLAGAEPEDSSEVIEATEVDVDKDDDAVMGDEDAPILMVEFSDFQCPYCRKFYDETLPLIKENYIDTGLVQFAYRDLPLVGLGHSDATPAANAAECAREQGGDEIFFKFHDKIFDGEGSWTNGTVSIPEENIYSYAEELGLDMDAFTSCQEGMDYQEEIDSDTAAARSIGINGTPGFVINGQVVTGAYPYDTFVSIFEQLLQ